jgi:N-formylglutamate amidohydrolase
MKKATYILLFLLPIISFSQTYTSGTTYFGTNNYTEYQAGNMPLILSSPHGGYLPPSAIPDRNCIGCVTGRDSYTQELTREVANAIKVKTNCFPHVIINKLHRKKLDANRGIIEATDSNTSSYVYWNDYNNFIDSARENIKNKTTKGLFIDIHGHGHSIQRIEIGYLLSKSTLQQSNLFLDSTNQINKSSIKNLSQNNLLSYSHSNLIRGTNSLGTMLSNKGYPSVPSTSIPFPLASESYFSGGYNTVKWGSRNGEEIDGIQLEHNQNIRFDSTLRKKYADSLAVVLLDYLEKHYFINFSSNYCFTNNLEEIKLSKIKIFPNPTKDFITIKTTENITKITLYDITGKLVLTKLKSKKLIISSLKKGVYFMRLYYENKDLNTFHKIIKE